MNLDYKWMSLEMMSNVYINIPEFSAPQNPSKKTKSEIVNAPEKKTGFFAWI